jgi:hypothetical protein
MTDHRFLEATQPPNSRSQPKLTRCVAASQVGYYFASRATRLKRRPVARPMDTDYLTEDAFQTIRVAREASPLFGAQLAVSGIKAKTEDEFLHCMLGLVKEFAENPEDTSDNLGEELTPRQVAVLCSKLRAHILVTLAKPIEERGDPGF